MFKTPPPTPKTTIIPMAHERPKKKHPEYTLKCIDVKDKCYLFSEEVRQILEKADREISELFSEHVWEEDSRLQEFLREEENSLRKEILRQDVERLKAELEKAEDVYDSLY